MTDVSTKTVLITGAARRIGAALAEAMARDGWAVAAHSYESTAECQALVERIRAAGRTAAMVEADLADEADAADLVAQATALIGPIGCVINNASIFERDDLATLTPASWSRHLDVNLRAPVFVAQAFARLLPPDERGAVINILDERVWNLTPHFLSYTTSKSALWTLTRTLALALAPRIRVNAVGPGPTLPSPRQTREQFDRQCRAMPLGHGTTPDEIADAVRYILSARSMTGQMIALDGGQHLGWGQVDRAADPED
jgi:NAD(P)-dependent dehydrogenase (short-subunit alcohol dehydrogenase family)